MTAPASRGAIAPDVDELCHIGRAAGLDAVGIAPAEPFLATRGHLEERRRAGLHGGMAFTYRNPSRSTDPAATVPGAKALVVAARSYRRGVGAAHGAAATAAESDRPAGRVARYAWDDAYGPLRAGLQAMADHLTAQGWQAVVVADDNALVDREAAYRAGIGWYGKNTNVLLPGRGSWFVLGSVITDAPIPSTDDPVPDGCGRCTRCIDACPTGAIVAPGVVDARRCLAWLVQATGDFPAEHRAALGTRIYGCDDCQEVCPPNRRVEDDVPEHESSGPGPGPAVDLLDLLECDDAALLARVGRWYIPRREPRYVRRNALVALGNTGRPAEPAVAAAVGRYLADPDPMLRRHAAWAAERLGLA